VTSPEPRLTSVEAGTLLARCRDERQVSLEQAAQALHLPRQILDHLEGGRLDAFDARIYYLGHLRRYAEWLGLAPETLIDRLAPLPEWDSPLTASASRDAQETPWGRARTRWLPAVLSGIFLVVAAGILIAYFAGLPAGRLPATHPSRMLAPRPPPPSPTSASARERRGALPVTQKPARPGPRPLALDFSFRHRSWLEVDRPGQIVYTGLLDGGKSLTLRVTPPVRIRIGNAPAVRLTVNGMPFALAPWTGSQRVAVVRLSGPPGKHPP
jgi:cytoskeleton protein RodZ